MQDIKRKSSHLVVRIGYHALYCFGLGYLLERQGLSHWVGRVGLDGIHCAVQVSLELTIILPFLGSELTQCFSDGHRLSSVNIE